MASKITPIRIRTVMGEGGISSSPPASSLAMRAAPRILIDQLPNLFPSVYLFALKSGSPRCFSSVRDGVQVDGPYDRDVPLWARDVYIARISALPELAHEYPAMIVLRGDHLLDGTSTDVRLLGKLTRLIKASILYQLPFCATPSGPLKFIPTEEMLDAFQRGRRWFGGTSAPVHWYAEALGAAHPYRNAEYMTVSLARDIYDHANGSLSTAFLVHSFCFVQLPEIRRTRRGQALLVPRGGVRRVPRPDRESTLRDVVMSSEMRRALYLYGTEVSHPCMVCPERGRSSRYGAPDGCSPFIPASSVSTARGCDFPMPLELFTPRAGPTHTPDRYDDAADLALYDPADMEL